MAVVYIEQENKKPLEVELREPHLAALLAWLFPGAGHFYQRRFAKGAIFAICILSIFVYGLALANGRCVYASTRKNDFRWQYFMQVGSGAITFPALLQSMVTKDGSDPLFVLCERYPRYDLMPQDIPEHKRKELQFEIIAADAEYEGERIKDGFMAPPAGPISSDTEQIDVLSNWHRDLQHRFELGTLFTIVAGLLNLLAVYDAYGGPMVISPSEKKKQERKQAKANKESKSESTDAESRQDSRSDQKNKSNKANDAKADRKK